MMIQDDIEDENRIDGVYMNGISLVSDSLITNIHAYPNSPSENLPITNDESRLESTSMVLSGIFALGLSLGAFIEYKIRRNLIQIEELPVINDVGIFNTENERNNVRSMRWKAHALNVVGITTLGVASWVILNR